MKRALIGIVFLCAGLAACDTAVRRDELQSVDYGPRPQHWQKEIQSYLQLRLKEPQPGAVDIRTEPKILYQRDTALRARQYGWAVCVWVTDREPQGRYPMTFFFRDEKIVAVNNGPDDFGVIGSRYAREQCELLGAPFRR
ncbi:MAG TPA: hypothetical protein VM489_08760 [Burkholderiales bacterium]|nr:hypothetical protein [Burkholderiales bacterium]